MRIMFAMAGAIAFLLVGTAFGQTNLAAIPPDCVSIYEVPLVCPAAPQIGCGSRAKPILLAFEKEPVVQSAWLNRAGTLLAIVWEPHTTRKQTSGAFKNVSRSYGLEARELKGAHRKEALADFFAGHWLRGSDVDRLSGEEAGIMAERLVRKIRTLVVVTDQQAKVLQEHFTVTLKHRLTGELVDRESAQEEIVKALRQQLSEKDALVLQQALKDYRPGRDGE